MEECATCRCGCQKFIIYKERVQCCECGREWFFNNDLIWLVEIALKVIHIWAPFDAETEGSLQARTDLMKNIADKAYEALHCLDETAKSL